MMHSSISYLLNLQLFFAKNHVNVTMATVLLSHPIPIKCWGCRRNKSQSEITFIHFEEISSHTYKGEVFLLIYLSYDVVLTRQVLQHTNKREQC